jgi:hypothetical protein
LIAQAQALRAGRVQPLAFYQTLKKLMAAAKLDPQATPQLTQYIAYLEQSVQLNPTALSHELDAFADKVRAAYASTPERQQLARILNELDLVQKLLNFRLSPAEYRQLEAAHLAEAAAQWNGFLSAQRAQQGLPAAALPDVAALQQALPTLGRFYTVAAQRDEALVRNAVAKIGESQERLVVLITGGFHSPEITRRLKEQGFGTVVMTPKVSQPTNERLYRAVVKYKSGRGSYDDVMAAAGVSALP